MNAKNLMNRVTKTVMVSRANAKLIAADRVGTGFMAVAMPLPLAEFLSPGQSLSQRLVHEPQPGSRQEEVSAMRYQLNAVKPTGLVGRLSGPVVRRSLFALPATRQTRQIHSWSHCSRANLGRDCQSPDFATDRTDRKRGTWQLAIPATRMSRPSAMNAN